MTLDDPEKLRELLRRADPASSLPPLRNDHRIRLIEDTMNRPHSTTATKASPGRTRRAWLLGGGAGVTAIGAAAIAVPLAIGPAMSATTLNQPPAGGPAAACAETTPEAIAATDSSFRATVTTIEGDTVTLTVTDRYHGEVTDTVTVTQGDGTGVDGEPLVFTPETSYLISTDDGMIITCGVSGEATTELNAIYSAAFPTP